MESPVVKGFWDERSFQWNDSLFFALVHIGLMTTAIVLITIGSALAKKAPEDRQKFNMVFTYYGIALLIILLAIPWPFSPLAQRPLLRF
jgi:predicted membrane channel-forming protein YqfA (hemolysin III family)